MQDVLLLLLQDDVGADVYSFLWLDVADDGQSTLGFVWGKIFMYQF